MNRESMKPLNLQCSQVRHLAGHRSSLVSTRLAGVESSTVGCSNNEVLFGNRFSRLLDFLICLKKRCASRSLAEYLVGWRREGAGYKQVNKSARSEVIIRARTLTFDSYPKPNSIPKADDESDSWIVLICKSEIEFCYVNPFLANWAREKEAIRSKTNEGQSQSQNTYCLNPMSSVLRRFYLAGGECSRSVCPEAVRLVRAAQTERYRWPVRSTKYRYRRCQSWNCNRTGFVRAFRAHTSLCCLLQLPDNRAPHSATCRCRYN